MTKQLPRVLEGIGGEVIRAEKDLWLKNSLLGDLQFSLPSSYPPMLPGHRITVVTWEAAVVGIVNHSTNRETFYKLLEPAGPYRQIHSGIGVPAFAFLLALIFFGVVAAIPPNTWSALTWCLAGCLGAALAALIWVVADGLARNNRDATKHNADLDNEVRQLIISCAAADSWSRSAPKPRKSYYLWVNN
jgi:hypothetical protein